MREGSGTRIKVMLIKDLYNLIDISSGDYEEYSAKQFEDLIYKRLVKHGKVLRQVKVHDRGDGRGGRIDLVFYSLEEMVGIPIEIDRQTVRKKSIFKVRLFNPINCFVITRSPYKIFKIDGAI